MRVLGPPLLVFSVLLLIAITLACGVNRPRALETVSVNPPTADAQNYGGQVQFAATGYFNTEPLQVNPAPATWGACYQGAPTADVSISRTGVAQCASGASGTYLVWAEVQNPGFKGMCTNLLTACGESCATVSGTALLTCP